MLFLDDPGREIIDAGDVVAGVGRDLFGIDFSYDAGDILKEGLDLVEKILYTLPAGDTAVTG